MTKYFASLNRAYRHGWYKINVTSRFTRLGRHLKDGSCRIIRVHTSGYVCR